MYLHVWEVWSQRLWVQNNSQENVTELDLPVKIPPYGGREGCDAGCLSRWPRWEQRRLKVGLHSQTAERNTVVPRAPEDRRFRKRVIILMVTRVYSPSGLSTNNKHCGAVMLHNVPGTIHITMTTALLLLSGPVCRTTAFDVRHLNGTAHDGLLFLVQGHWNQPPAVGLRRLGSSGFESRYESTFLN